MGLSDALARLAVRAAQVLVVETPGHWLTRVELERQMQHRGWRPAWTPADADVLAICGVPGPDLSELVDRLWEEMPGPRVRVDVASPNDANSALDDAVTILLDTSRHRKDARERAQEPEIPEDHGDQMGHEDMDHGDMDHGDMDHGEHNGHEDMDHDGHEGMDHGEHEGHGGRGDKDRGDMDHPEHGDMDHGGHEGMDHGEHEDMNHGEHEGHHGRGDMDPSGHGDMDHGEHEGHADMDHSEHEDMDHGEHEGHERMDHSGHGGMDMAPAGIPLAQGGEDRDGLGMDVLHLPLGPVLPFWPAGLVLRCSLQGDVVVDAEASVIDGDDDGAGPPVPGLGPASAAAVRCDNAERFLALAGAEDAAARARRARDALLRGDQDTARADVDRLQRTVRRSRLLRWSLRNLLSLDRSDLERHGLPMSCRGDAYDRLLSLVERIRAEIGGEEAARVEAVTVPWATLPQLVAGLELGSVRLAVASLDLDPFPAVREVGHA